MARINFLLKNDSLELAAGALPLCVSIKCPIYVIDGQTYGDKSPNHFAPFMLIDENLVELPYDLIVLASGGKLETKLLLRWSASESVLRKWAQYRLLASDSDKVVEKIILDRLALSGLKVEVDPDLRESHPAFMPGFFVGIEFPIGSSRIEKDYLILSHHPGLRLKAGEWYETQKAVYGAAPVGQERRAFQRYISLHRPAPYGSHFNYNSWWTSPAPYSEHDIVSLMQTFEGKLYRARDVSFDTFAIDLGWSKTNSMWEISEERFPMGFTNIQEAAGNMNCRLGLWISPSNPYTPYAADNEWLHQQGYETFSTPSWQDPKITIRHACLGGERYQEGLRQRLVDMVTRYGIRHIKFDGYSFECTQDGHGHEPGPLSTEAVANGIINVFRGVREAAPDVWFEPTCFGFNPSPWWLFYVNSVIGSYGDDAPYGRVPSPIYRESYTTARDYYNLQGAYWSAVPVAAQEVLGIVHQTPEPFLNDAVITVMRGHMFIPVYLNPKYMDDRRWQALAELMSWARRNSLILQETVPLLPGAWQEGNCPRFTDDTPMPREPYGYFHGESNRALIALRNPWIEPQTYAITLDADFGLRPEVQNLAVVSLYPAPRVYARGLKFGDKLEIPLAPYETVVLSLASDQDFAALPSVSEAIGGQIAVLKCDHSTAKNYTDSACSITIKLEAEVDLLAQQGTLLALLEGEKALRNPICHMHINGESAKISHSDSESGWSATLAPAKPENWIFLSAPLSHGKNCVSADISAADCKRISFWIWATEPGASDPPIYPNALPQPEIISMDAVKLGEWEISDNAVCPERAK